MKNLGEVSQCLGTKINKTKEVYTLNQKLKIKELVKKIKLENTKPVGTLMESGFNCLEDDDNLLLNNTKFRRAIG